MTIRNNYTTLLLFYLLIVIFSRMPKIPYSLTFFTLGMLLAGVELSGKFTISDILKEEKIV